MPLFRLVTTNGSMDEFEFLRLTSTYFIVRHTTHLYSRRARFLYKHTSGEVTGYIRINKIAVRAFSRCSSSQAPGPPFPNRSRARTPVVNSDFSIPWSVWTPAKTPNDAYRTEHHTHARMPTSSHDRHTHSRSPISSHT